MPSISTISFHIVRVLQTIRDNLVHLLQHGGSTENEPVALELFLARVRNLRPDSVRQVAQGMYQLTLDAVGAVHARAAEYIVPMPDVDTHLDLLELAELGGMAGEDKGKKLKTD